MKIITLMENTQGEEGCAFEHGLSLYIETEKHKILADTGATGAFAENAEKLGVNLSSVYMVVLSHGHYDHSGGILTFTEKNRHVCGLRTMRRYLSGVYLIFRLHQQIAECYDGGD